MCQRAIRIVSIFHLVLGGDYDVQNITLTPSHSAIAKLSLLAPQSSEKVSELTAAFNIQDDHVGIATGQGTAQADNSDQYWYSSLV